MGDPKAFSEDLVAMRDQVATELDGILAAVKDQRRPSAKPVAKPSPPTDATDNPILAEPASPPPAPKRSRPAAEPTPEQAIWENVTTRLTRETNRRLTEAALKQRLHRAKPDSRQGIIEEAVKQWISGNQSNK
jgi:hypothetical protein